MKPLTRTLAIFLALSFLFICTLGQKALAIQRAKSSTSEIVGKWEGGVSAGGAAMNITLELKNEGNKIVGQINNPHGSWDGDRCEVCQRKWTIAWRTSEDGTGKMIGTLKDNKLAGDWDFSPAFVGTFELTKATSAAK